jgi:hypothetical protein
VGVLLHPQQSKLGHHGRVVNFRSLCEVRYNMRARCGDLLCKQKENDDKKADRLFQETSCV